MRKCLVFAIFFACAAYTCAQSLETQLENVQKNGVSVNRNAILAAKAQILRKKHGLKDFSLENVNAAFAAIPDPETPVSAWEWREKAGAYGSSAKGEISSAKGEIKTALKKALRQYIRISGVLEMANAAENFSMLLENIVRTARDLQEKNDPLLAGTLSGVIQYLDDITPAIPEAGAVSRSLKAEFGQNNFSFWAKDTLVATFFDRNVVEQAEISEWILGSRVQGDGTLAGASTAYLVPNDAKAEIRVMMNATFNSKTVSSKSVVRLHSANMGAISTHKSLYLNPFFVGTKPSKTESDLATTVLRTFINGGPIIKCIAMQKIAIDSPKVQAAGKRRTEMRLGQRVDQAIEPLIADFNKKLQKYAVEPLKMLEIDANGWKMSTTSDYLKADFKLANEYQLAAPTKRPDFEQNVVENADAFCCVHQSAINNLAALLLAGKTFDEQKIDDNLSVQLGRNTDEQPLIVTFAKIVPISVAFQDNKFVVTLRLDKIQERQANTEKRTVYPGVDIIIAYEIAENGSPELVLVSADAFPPGFVPDGGSRIPARFQVIRSIIQRRLANSLPKTVILEGREIPERELSDGSTLKSIGKIVPALVKSENGWLSMALKLHPRENNFPTANVPHF